MSATAHPFAAVLGCHDPDTDTIYLVHAIRMKQALPPNHVDAIKQHPCWDAPVLWPHDGARADLTGQTYVATYKKLGLRMHDTHTTFRGGGYNFEGGIADMEQRFASGRLKVAAHLAEWWDEYRNYHRDGNGVVVKVDDDLLSGTRQICMGIRFAQPLLPDRAGQSGAAMRGWDGTFHRRGSNSALNTDAAIAARCDFPLW
jgi:hypothetical protein